MDDLGVTWEEPENPEAEGESDDSEDDSTFETAEEEGCESDVGEFEDDMVVEEPSFPSTEFPPTTVEPNPAGTKDLAEQPEPKPDAVTQAKKNHEVITTPPPKAFQPPAITPEAVIVSCFPFDLVTFGFCKL